MFVEHLMAAVVEADLGASGMEMNSELLTGYSGTKLIGALRLFGKLFEEDPTACYLEVGVFQGLTLLSVASALPNLQCFGIDNFAYFDPDNKNLGIFNERKHALKAENAHLINADYEDALEALGSHIGTRKVAIYFVDGPHDYRSQLMCLQLALPFMHEHCVIIVDDSNYRHVRQANRDFLVTHPDFRLMFDAYTSRHPANMTPSDEAAARAGWWNGVNIIVRDPSGILHEMLPPTYRSRALYEQEHITHTESVADQLDLGLGVLRAMDLGSPRKVLRAFARMALHLRRTRNDREGRFVSANTYSDGLPTARLNSHARAGGAA
jgi:hypothetical protein